FHRENKRPLRLRIRMSFVVLPPEAPRAPQEQPLVEPQVAHFMHVPSRTSVKWPHSPHASASSPCRGASRRRSSPSPATWVSTAPTATAAEPALTSPDATAVVAFKSLLAAAVLAAALPCGSASPTPRRTIRLLFLM